MNAAPEIAFSSERGKANYAAARRQYPAQAIVDLKTMRDNMAHLVSVVGGPASGTAVLGVVKADAYGHGLLPARPGRARPAAPHGSAPRSLGVVKADAYGHGLLPARPGRARPAAPHGSAPRSRTKRCCCASSASAPTAAIF